jgi:hypothetical protein
VPLFIFNPLSNAATRAHRLPLESHLIMKNLNLLLANLLHGGYHLSPAAREFRPAAGTIITEPSLIQG